MKFALIVLVTFCVFSPFCSVNAKWLTICEIAKELKTYGPPFDIDRLPDWYCLINEVSSGRTDRVNKDFSDGIKRYGLFQVDPRYHCQDGDQRSENLCNANCEAMITDNINRAVLCAKKIYERDGFGAWQKWKDYCKGRRLDNVKHCFSRSEL